MQFVCCLHVRLANVFLIVLLSNITYVASQGIFTYSGISVAVIGDKVEMNCIEIGNFWTWRYTSWTYTSWNTSTERGIYLGGDILDSMGSRYTFERRFSGQHNLIINSVDLAHAGRYRCTSVIRETLRTDIQLIVLASHPVCAANISAARDEGNEKRHPDLFMWCSVTYTGNGLPVFNWTKGNVDKNIVAKTTTPGSNGGPLIKTSSFTEQLHYNDSGVAIQCQITFQMRNNYTYMYEGVHVYTWNYTLPYGPLNLRIVQYEDRLECSADGNPTPAYRWTGVDSKRSIEGPVFILDDKDQTVQCTTTNMYANERKNYTIKNGFHGPRNLRIVEYEDHLECSADGNPTPTYRWTRVDIRNSIEGHVIMLADKGQILQCTATNAFATEKKNFTVTNDFTDRRSVCGLHAVELVVIASIAIVFGIVLLIIGLKLRKLSIAFDKVVDKTSTNASSFPPHQLSKKLSSPQPTDEYAEIERADATDNTYCALEKQPTAAQKTEVYCELRPIDQRNTKQSAKQRVENKDRQ